MMNHDKRTAPRGAARNVLSIAGRRLISSAGAGILVERHRDVFRFELCDQLVVAHGSSTLPASSLRTDRQGPGGGRRRGFALAEQVVLSDGFLHLGDDFAPSCGLPPIASSTLR